MGPLDLYGKGNVRSYPHPHGVDVRVIDSLDEKGHVVATRNEKNYDGLLCYERIGSRVTKKWLVPQGLGLSGVRRRR